MEKATKVARNADVRCFWPEMWMVEATKWRRL